MSLWEQLKKLDKSLHINNFLPNYISKWFFYVALFQMLILFLLVCESMDFNFNQISYSSCPENTIMGCNNIFYECNRDFINFDYISICNMLGDIDCSTGICDKEFLSAGEFVGEKPSHFYNNFSLYIFFIIFFAFIMNHIYYLRGLKKHGISFKSEIRKGKKRLDRFLENKSR